MLLVQNLGFNCNLNGLGCNVIPSFGSVFGNGTPFGTIKVNACINVAKYKNKLDFAKCSPMQRRLPVSMKKKIKFMIDVEFYVKKIKFF